MMKMAVCAGGVDSGRGTNKVPGNGVYCFGGYKVGDAGEGIDEG